MATPWRFESSPGHHQLFRHSSNISRRSSRNPVRSTSYGVFCCLQIPCVLLTSTIFAYARFEGKPMPRRVEPKSELEFRAAKTRTRSYLLGDGSGLAVRVRPNGTKTWLFRYRRPGNRQGELPQPRPYPDVTLAYARRSATAARNLVREGIDPVEHRRAESTARKRAAYRFPDPLSSVQPGVAYVTAPPVVAGVSSATGLSIIPRAFGQASLAVAAGGEIFRMSTAS